MIASILSIDTQILFLLNNLVGQSQWSDCVVIFLATYLPFIVVAGFALYILRYSNLTKHEQIVALVLSSTAALVARIGIVSPIRFFFPRERPFVALDVHDLFVVSSSSFPSGHAAFFFAFSTIVFFYNRKLGALYFLLTMMICAARVAAGVHYPSDILGGLIVGVGVGVFVHAYLRASIGKVVSRVVA